MSSTRGFRIAATLTAGMPAGGTMAMGGETTRLKNLTQPPLNTTMMGVLKGVADYYGLDLGEPMVYGLSGHAFLINIHIELCPSGPYCWKRENAAPLLENMGMRMTDLGFFSPEAKEEARAGVEKRLREALDKGIPCSLLNLENQLITGYDAAGFFSAQPWKCNPDFPPATLSFGSWKELGKEYHINFYTIEKGKPIDRKAAVLASLEYAVDLWKNPAKHDSEKYAVGPKAYDHWIAAVPVFGSEHGNWWNATVWSECRRMAAEHFVEIGKENRDVSNVCAELNREYLAIAGNLKKASSKTMEAGEKAKLLAETKALEAGAIEKVGELASALRAGE